MIDRVIFDELCNGILRDASRRAYSEVIARLADAGCDAVALACTEIPLLVTPEASRLPTLDSTRLLATAAVEVAVGAREFPAWRGGPVASMASGQGLVR
jgi:aspartate racemase